MSSIKKIFLWFLFIVIISCKKEKDDPSPPPASPPVTPAPARLNIMSATINGTTWVVTGNQTSTASISVGTINTTPKTFVVQGYTQQFSRHSIYIGFPYTIGVGTHTIEMGGEEAYGAYDDYNGTGYFAKTGTINISVFDTSRVKSPVCDKFKATFSFTTVSIGQAFKVENGIIDFEAN
jgi:hypothetical protein